MICPSTIALPRLQSKSNGIKVASESVDDMTPEDSDMYVGAQVNLPMDGKLRSATIIRQARTSV